VQIFVEFRNKSWLTDETYALVDALGWVVSGTVIRKEPDNEKWIGTMPPGTYLPPASRTPSATYTRVHGSKGYRGAYGEKGLKQLYTAIREKGAEANYVVFNNTFFERGDGPCPVGKIGKAAACDAVMFARIAAGQAGGGAATRKRRKRSKRRKTRRCKRT
jgi:uncharacterized protein YecE (DUF72 family)